MPTLTATPSELTERLAGLQRELADLAFALDRRGRADAADVARLIANRLSEVVDGAESSVGEEPEPSSSRLFEC